MSSQTIETVALEAAKSMFSLAWALTLFTGRELTSLMFDPMTPIKDMSVLFNTLADTMAGCLGPSGRAVYRVGDRIQRNMTESLFPAGGGSQEQSAGWGPVVNDGSEDH